MTPSERGERAQQLLDDPVFVGALAEMRAGLVDALESVPLSDVDTQHETALLLQLLKRLRMTLERYVIDGKVEDIKRERESILARTKQKLSDWM